jgi:predicted enzyme related to lactoylglutathione lyase
MLANAILKAFVPTIKPDEARVFYGNVLGFKALSEDDYALEFDAGGTPLRVIIVPELQPHAFTILGWNVTDIAATIRQLNTKGVYCEKYDFMDQDELGIWNSPGVSKVAWFKDPDGNVLSLTQ